MLIPWSKAVRGSKDVRGGEDSEAGAGVVHVVRRVCKVGLQDPNLQLEL